MSYQVIWGPTAGQVLDTHYHLARETGSNPETLDRAVSRVKALLGDDPQSVGESRTDDERILIHVPLSEVYEVFPTTNVVLIYEVRVWYRAR